VNTVSDHTYPVDVNGLPIPATVADHRYDHLQAITGNVITDIAIYDFIKECVNEVLHGQAEQQARALYKVVMDWPVAEIMTMGEEQFIALYRSVLEAE